jgi:hypothetical protein
LNEEKKKVSEALANAARLKKQNEEEQRYKASVNAKLNSSLDSLQHLAEGSTKTLKSLGNITETQKGNTATQQVVLLNTMRTLSPLKPYTLGYSYTINVDEVQSQPQFQFIRDFYDHFALIRDSLENKKYKGLRDFIVSNVRGHPEKIGKIAIWSNSVFQPAQNSKFWSFIHSAVLFNLLKLPNNKPNLRDEPGAHLEIRPATDQDVYLKDGNNNDLKIIVNFPGKIIVRVISNKIEEVGGRNGAQDFYSILDLANHYIYLNGDFPKFLKMNFISFHPANGTVTCLKVTEAERVGEKKQAYRRLVKPTEIDVSDCSIDGP